MRICSRRSGFTLIEVALAIAVGLTVLAASVYGYQQVQKSSRFSKAKSIVGTVQTNVAMEKFRTGSPPPMTRLQSNQDSANKPFWPEEAGRLPIEPVTGADMIATFDSMASPVPLAAGDAENLWDNPVFLPSNPSPAPSPGYGKGGWLYDANTGAFRVNLSNKDYPEQRPSNW